VSKGLPKQPDRKNHFAALPYAKIPAFIPKLKAINAGEPAKLALEFLILTASRTGEVLGARWSEVDLKERVWTIPAARMKAGREHRVSLVTRSLAILTRCGWALDEPSPARLGPRHRRTAQNKLSCKEMWVD
jgi:integrase